MDDIILKSLPVPEKDCHCPRCVRKRKAIKQREAELVLLKQFSGEGALQKLMNACRIINEGVV